MLDPDEVSSLNTSWLVDYAESPSSPDNGSSPGALYLIRVRDNVLRQWRRDPENVNTNSLAESAISQGTSDMWREFVDLEAWEESAYGDLVDGGREALTTIGERLGDRLVEELNEWREEQEDDYEEDEEPFVLTSSPRSPVAVAADEW